MKCMCWRFFTAIPPAHPLHKTHISVFVQFLKSDVALSLPLTHRHSILCDEKSIIDCVCWIFIIIMPFREERRKSSDRENGEGDCG